MFFRILLQIPVAVVGVPLAFLAAAVDEVLGTSTEFPVYDAVNAAGKAAKSAGEAADHLVQAVTKGQPADHQ